MVGDSYVPISLARITYLTITWSKGRWEMLLLLWFLFVETGILCVALTVSEHSVDQAGLELGDLPTSAS